MPLAHSSFGVRFGLMLVMLGGAQSASARSLFLNGTDISSARSQELKNVNIVINENGDIFIIAPHYQVNEEDTYIPLSKYVQGAGTPSHKASQGQTNGKGSDLLPSHPSVSTVTGKAIDAATGAPAGQIADDGQLDKAGTDGPGDSLPPGGAYQSLQDKSN